MSTDSKNRLLCFMPLISVETLENNSDTRLALWHITETIDELLCLANMSDSERNNLFQQNKSTSRQREILAVKALLDRLFRANVTLSHNADGCPLLSNGCNVSISHTKGWAAVIVSHSQNVAVDIEYKNSRVLKVKKMFIRTDENASSLTSALLHWCAKETLYKLHSAEHLSFMEMRVNDILGNKRDGIILTESLRSEESTQVHYHVTDDFVLTCTY